jgi:hypothetical protein
MLIEVKGVKMKNILPLLVVSILVLCGLGAVAIANSEQIVKKTLNTEDWALEIKVKGGILGYQLTVENVGNKTVIGNLTMNITTDAFIMLLGRNLRFPLCSYQMNLLPGEKESFNPGPIIGLGPATISVSGEFKLEDTTFTYPFETKGSGFVLLFFNNYESNTITLP